MRVPFFSGTINSASTYDHPTGKPQAREQYRVNEPDGSQVGWRIGGYSVAADVGCVLCTVCRRLRGGAWWCGQDEWTMRDKIPVPGSSTHGIDVSLLLGDAGCRRCEHNGRVRLEVAHSIDARRPPSSWHGACRRICICVRRPDKPPL